MLSFDGWLPALLQGAMMAIRVALSAALLGLFIGLLAAWAGSSRHAVLRYMSDAYATVVRALPNLLVILIVYFGSTTLATSVANTMGWATGPVYVPPFTAGIVALGLIFGAYATEVFRGAFDEIPKGMIEAAIASGMSKWKVLRVVKLPQMLRFALPGLGNTWISTVKDTSLISVVGLEEIMRVSELATTSTQRPLFFYIAAAATFLVLTFSSDLAIEKLERWARRGERSRQ